jgi:hypothetical protein
VSVDPPKDDGIDRLLQEIARNLDENQRFIKGLKEDRMDEPEDLAASIDAEEDFEEL